MYHMLMLPPHFQEEEGLRITWAVAEVGPVPTGSRSARHMGKWRQPNVRP